MKDLTKELQGRNREVLCKNVEFKEKPANYIGLSNKERAGVVLDTLTAQTVQATKERVKEIVEGERRTREDYMTQFDGWEDEMRFHNQALDKILTKLNNI